MPKQVEPVCNRSMFRCVTIVYGGSMHEISQALKAWNIDDFTLDRNLGGSSRASWRIFTNGKPYVLRKTEGQHAYLDYQIVVLRHLEKTNFPYATPRLMPTAANGAVYAETGDESRWILYPFIAGSRPGRFAVRRVRGDIAKLVARFDASAADIDLGARTGYYALTLFDREEVTQRLAAWEGMPQFQRVSRRAIASILDRYLTITEDEIAAVDALPKQTLYNDWHRWNLVADQGRVTGLIDFDSLVEAPRIVDVQNALGYVLMSAIVPWGGVVPGFMRGYCEVSPLSSDELPLLWPVMIDRLAWLLSDEIARGGSSRRMFRILRVLHWMSKRRDKFEATLLRIGDQYPQRKL